MNIDLPKMDPTPYINASYGIALFLIGIYFIWLFLDQKELKSIQDSTKKGDDS